MPSSPVRSEEGRNRKPWCLEAILVEGSNFRRAALNSDLDLMPSRIAAGRAIRHITA
jgi:hypothetical protein